MELGCFSVSLAVKDLERSRAFYEALGFETHGGDASQGWLILRNGDAKIGLFQGMFAKNILTFSPGLDEHGKKMDSFTDVREIQAKLEEKGLELTTKADPGTSGPASATLTDPDGNPILIDQYF